MAEKEDQFGSCSSGAAMTTNPDSSWAPQPAIPLWCLKKDNVPLSEAGHRSREEGGEDSSRKSSVVIDDTEDESGLELSLGLSLGGPFPKPKPRSGQKDGGIGAEKRGGGGGSEQLNQESSSRKLTRRDSDGSISRTQAFWQEFDISRDSSQLDEKPSHLNSDVHLRERHTPSVSSLSSSISPLSSLGLPDTWRSAENPSIGEESKAALAHPFWQSMQEKPSQPEQGNGKEELSIFQALSAPPPHSAAALPPAWARFGQSGVVMPLLDGFKETGEENPRAPFPATTKDCKIPPASVPGDAGEGGHLQHPKGGDALSSDQIGLLTSDPRHAQESIEQQKKQKKQEARKRRKACMEEQKMQKKTKEDEAKGVLGPTQKHVGSRSGTPPPGPKLSPSPPQPANAREVSSPPDSQEAGSASPGVRRTSSGLWSRAGNAWDGQTVGSSPEKTPEKESLDPSNEDGKQLLEIRRALQRERDRAAKEKVWDVEKESESRQESERRSPAEGDFGQAFKGDEANGPQPAGSGHGQENSAAAPASGTEMNKVQTDAGWVQRMLEAQMGSHSAYQMAAALMDNKEQLLKGLPDLNGIQRKGLENALSAVDRERLKAFGPSASEQAEKGSERSKFESRNGDTKPEIGNRSNAAMAGGSHPASGSLMAYSQPANFPLMHMAYPFPVPVAGPNGLPFPMPYPFPYMMQFAASADSASAQERTGAPTLPSSFPGASSHLPYQVVGDVATPSWAPVLRPQATPPHSPPRTLVRSSSGMAEEDNRNSQGAKKNDNVRSVSPGKDASMAGTGHTLIRASSLGSAQGQVGAFARLRPSPNLPPTPQFGPIRTRSDAGEAIIYRDGNSITGISAFASLVAAVEASQGLSAAFASVNTSNKQPTTQRLGGGAKLERIASRALHETVEEVTGASSSSKASSQQQGETQHGDSVSRTSSNTEEVKVTGNRFQQGTTTTSISEGLISQMGEEGSCLKAGFAASQMFGGSGSSPDLPWVTCKGAGPNGKTISGVLYKYNKGQVRIVCACHGRHMSPSEFVQHAGSEDLSNPEKSIVVNSFPQGSQAASAQG